MKFDFSEIKICRALLAKLSLESSELPRDQPPLLQKYVIMALDYLDFVDAIN